MMSRYHVTLTDEQVRKALHRFIQDELYPNRTVGNAVYFSHDLITGTMLVELSYPLSPEEEDDYEWAEEEEEWEDEEDEENDNA